MTYPGVRLYESEFFVLCRGDLVGTVFRFKLRFRQSSGLAIK